MTPDLTFHEIVSLDDGIYDAWLDLYQTAFPLNEQMRVSAHNQVLRGKQQGASADRHLLAALDATGHLVSMARYDVLRACQAAALWYLAVVPRLRSQGIGSRLYLHILERLRSEAPAASRTTGPLVSIVVLNRDGEPLLRRLLPALAQTELVELQVAGALGQVIHLVHHQQNRTARAAQLRGDLLIDRIDPLCPVNNQHH